MEPLTLTIVSVLAVAALVASTFGFGVGLIAMPVLAAMVDIQTATPLVALVIMTVVVIVLLRQWRDVEFYSVWRLILASVLGIPLGLFLLKGIHDQVMKLALAIIIMGFSGYNIFTPHMLTLKTDRASYLFGILAGVLGGAYTIPGPPIVIYGVLRQWSPNAFRVTLLGCFFPITTMLLAGHYSAGLWTPTVLRLFALSLPAVLVAIAIGNYINRAMPGGKFDKVIHILLMGIGLVLSVQVLKTMLSAS